MLAKIQLFICLFAAVVVSVVSILQNTPLVVMVFRLIFFIILFYFIGLFVRFYLKKKVFIEPEANPELLQGDENPLPTPPDGENEDVII